MKYYTGLGYFYRILFLLCLSSGLYAELSIETSPSTAQLVYEEALDLTVHISGVTTPMRAFEIELNFDPEFLSITPGSFTEGSFLSDIGETTWYLTSSSGGYTLTCAISGVTSGATGSGSLFHVHLSALEQGTGIEGTDITLPDPIIRGVLNDEISVDSVCGSNIQIAETYAETQEIQLSAGWNMISTRLIPSSLAIDDIFGTLINSGTLVKVQNEEGAIYVEDIQGGWINEIGEIIITDGYYVNVCADCTLHISGAPIQFPFSVPLSSGWNIIAYPSDTEQNAITIVQDLIGLNSLIKVQDESGNIIAQDISNDWFNDIGSFKPGEGYYMNVLGDTELIYENQKSSPQTLNKDIKAIDKRNRK